MTAASTAGSGGRIGPNAVVQLGQAMSAEKGAGAAEALFRRAGHGDLLFNPPTRMIDERVPARLFAQLWRDAPGQAAQIATEAGRRTADYVIAHRIPHGAKVAMRLLPKRIAAFLLINAIRRNAWTFAGSGSCDVAMKPQPKVFIKDNPLKMPDCAWHQAVLEQLFRRLVSEGAIVRHSTARRRGEQVSQFEIELSGC